MFMDYIENIVQLIAIMAALMISLFRYIGCKRHRWLYAVVFFLGNLLSSYFWTAYLIIMGDTPNVSNVLAYFGWNVAFLSLAILVIHLKTKEERRYLHPFMLLPVIPEKYRGLDTQALRDKRRNWTAELAPDTVQDEFAIASFLLDMGDYLHGGECPYPLQEALEDARFWMRLQELSR